MLKVGSRSGGASVDGEGVPQADEHLLKILVQNKKQTLASLQGELEVVLPMLAQLQARAAETKRQLTDRHDSAVGGRLFVAALKDRCERSQKHADEQAVARESAAGSIEGALNSI